MVIDIFRNRRSVRDFLDKPIEREKVEQLQEAVLLSPSSRNFNPWEFVFVEDKEVLKKLAISKKHGNLFLQNAPIGVVVCADPEKCDVWIEDCSIASIYLILEAEELGLGACWIQIRKRMYDDKLSSEDYIKKLTGLPDEYRIESIIAIGYPKQKKPPKTREDLLYNKIHYNKYE